jgi:cytochrome c oxidase subunit 3
MASSRQPVLVAGSLFLQAVAGLAYLHPEVLAPALQPARTGTGPAILAIGLIPLAAALALWTMRAAANPSDAQADRGLRLGMLAFILSEIMFSVALIWAYLHYATEPALAGLTSWPPAGIRPEDPWGGPTLNTLVLLASGVAVATAHHALTRDRRAPAIAGLALGIALAGLFLGLQAREFLLSTFGYRDGVYPSVFFLALGLHVFIGAVLLAICATRLALGVVRPAHLAAFDASVWYWHFVDAIWLVLFLLFYVAAGAGLYG